MKLIPSDAETGDFRQGVFLKLSDCPPDFQAQFSTARKAIEEDQQDDLEAAVKAMKESTVPSEHVLDVCDMVPDPVTDPPFKYPVTLLAFAGYHARFDMLDFLIEEGAHVDMGDKKSGTPLLQLLMYAKLKEKEQELDEDVVEYLIESGANLGRVLTHGSYSNSTILEMAISFHRFDIAQMLVDRGADPILGGDGIVSPVFTEYAQFGTNKFVQWLLKKYQSQGEIPAFINRFLGSNVLYREEMRHTITTVFGRNPAHTFLLSGNEEAITYLVDKNRDILKECDLFKRTALHLAARDGDATSVKILLDCDAAIDVEDENLMTPLMLATKNGHEEVVKLIDIFSSRNAGASSAPMGLWPWALQYGYPAYFEAYHRTEQLERVLMSPLDNDDNTITHLAAEGGHVSVFKATFPKAHGDFIFGILTKPNKQKKTPLHLAIENGNVGILNALQERRKEREKQAAAKKELFQQQAESVEKRAWKDFWDSESPGLLLYACLHGTVDIVKYFVTKLVSPTTRNKHHTPLSCAAKAGKHDIVAYLLTIKGVTAEGTAPDEVIPDAEKPHSPLMLAAKHGHAKCVTILLERNADVDVRTEQEYNCFMESIEEGHEDVAIAFLSHPETWKKSMRVSVKKKDDHDRDLIVTPMRMLIEHMPNVAKLALTKCVSKVDAKAGRTHGLIESGSVKHVVYDFEFIEDFSVPAQLTPSTGQNVPLTTVSASQQRRNSADDAMWFLIDDEDEDDVSSTAKEEDVPNQPLWDPEEYSALQHPLALMVKHERLSLLQHPLIYRYINYKWWNVSFPLFLIYIVIYILFLCLLTWFTVSLPRPGPENQFCPRNSSDGSSLDSEDCRDPDASDRRSYTALAITLIFMSIGFLVFEVWFRYVMREWSNFYFFFEAFVRAGVFLLTIVFVFGFWNDCWCAPPWQWQIGALTLFMAYINILLTLKRMPILGVPITMLLNIVVTFIKLIYLPVLLILAFAIPFYMVFVRQVGSDGILTAFSTPAESFAKTIMQTAGELDYGTVFDEAPLLYTPMAYILFILFVVLMPILFSNLLVGLAVGTTEEDAEKATFTNIQLQVDYIVQVEDSLTLRRYGKLPYIKYSNDTKRNWFLAKRDKMRGVDYKSQKKLVEELYEEAFDSEGEHKEAVQVLKEKVTQMAEKMESLEEKIPALERSHKQLQEALQETLESSMEENKARMKTLESRMEDLQSDVGKILEKLES